MVISQRRKMTSVNNRIALVTVGSRGLGRSTALALALAQRGDAADEVDRDKLTVRSRMWKRR